MPNASSGYDKRRASAAKGGNDRQLDLSARSSKTSLASEGSWNSLTVPRSVDAGILHAPGINKLDSPFETHDWAVRREGFLRRLRTTLGRTRVTVMLFLLKQHPVTRAAALECYLVKKERVGRGEGG